MPASSRRRIVTLVLGLAVLQALAIAGYFLIEGARDAGRAAPLRYERVTKRLSLRAVDIEARGGRVLSTSSFRGRPILLHFWATWCPPCREELPALLALRERGDLRIVAVSLDDDWGAVERFFGGEVPAEVVRDLRRELRRHYEVGTLPDTYLLDESGAAVARFGGARFWGTDAASETLDALVAGRPLPRD